MTQSIFYSWQSDSPPKTNRYFIRECLHQVLKKLSKDEDIQDAIRLDQDTAGIPGTPDIANAIFGKIRDAGVFVADLTLCSTSEEGKRSSNPNVLIELGYAFSAIGDARVVTILNTIFGDAQQLPFDLAHKRWPIRYALSLVDLENKEKKDKEQKKLVDDLYNAVHLVLQTVSKSPPLTSGRTGGPSFDYIEQTILRSDPQEGWERVSDSVSSLGISRTDVNLRLVMKFTAEGVQRDTD
jgi:hypothetical protein